jgi:enoyl-CoA hydratase/carnithine racemase
VGIITGAGDKAFCAGADIKTMLPYMREVVKGETWREPPTPMRGLELWKPMIAAVNGVALGGGTEIALACDIRIAAENARFGQPEVKLGIIPGWGGTQRLPRHIPYAIAAQMILTGEPISAQDAYRVGLVNEVVPLPQLMATAEKWANKILEVGPLAARAGKEAMLMGTSMTLEEGLRYELMLFDNCISHTEDAQEGINAFIEKRKPQWRAK